MAVAYIGCVQPSSMHDMVAEMHDHVPRGVLAAPARRSMSERHDLMAMIWWLCDCVTALLLHVTAKCGSTGVYS